MRISRIAALAAATVAIAAVAGPALAQATGGTNPYDVSWAALNPGSDWSATVLNSLFPIPGNAQGQSTGNEATVVGQIAGQFTGFVAAIACAFVCYTVIMNIHRAAESSQILGNGQSWMFVVRTGFAGIMMFPLAGNFSAGQQLVMQGAMWGAGMAKVLYTSAVTAVGPDAAVIATPMIPGTQTVVAGLINSELCMDLVNLASGTTQQGPLLMAAPAPLTVNDGTGSGFVSYRYSLSTGNESGDPACGTVTVRESGQNASTVAGVNVDMAAVQSAVLNNVLTGVVRPGVATIAQQLWQTKSSAALAGLQGVYTQGVQTYTQALTAAATSIQQSINAALASNATQARNGNLDLAAGATQQSTLGWTSAGAYYLEIARANAATLSLLTSLPVTTAPTYDGFPPSLAQDMAPFGAEITSFMSTLQQVVNSQDGIDHPSGSPATLATAQQASYEPLSFLGRLFRAMTLDGASLQKLIAIFGQTNATIWTDPFGALMSTGQTLIITSLIALGATALLQSVTGSLFAALGMAATGNFGGSAAALAGHAVISFIAVPVYALVLSMMIPGIIIAYVLPMIPYVMWIAGVAGWIVLVCEAMFAVPLWMLAHMTVGGDGLHGRAVDGWGLLFNVVFRPSLMLIGLFLSYFVFDCMSWLIRESFGIAAGFVLDNGYIVTNWIGAIVMMNIFVMLNLTAALTAFRMITLIPHHLPRLIGFSPASRVDMEGFYQQAAWGAGSQIAQGSYRNLVAGGDVFAKGANRIASQSLRRELIAHAAGEDRQTQGSMDTTLRATTDSVKVDSEAG
jgi:conjugal transfer/type IV secretion protein DotA/TraY